MATMRLEKDIEDDACDKALVLGVINVKMKAAGHRGWPDRMFMIPGGSPLFIEFKRPGCTTDTNQDIIIRRLRHYGYQVEICDTVEEAVAHIKSAIAGHPS